MDHDLEKLLLLYQLIFNIFMLIYSIVGLIMTERELKALRGDD